MINQRHRDMLAASGITPERAELRGYETITDPNRLARLVTDHQNGRDLGIVKDGRRVPGLLIPLRAIDGSVWSYQYRPDVPRLREGKQVRYESIWGWRNGLDFPLGIAETFADPAVPKLLTEGSKKADAAALRGLCAISVSGVWNWRGRNERGGLVAVADWNDVAIKGSRIILAYDSDAARKESVHKAMRELANYLAIKGARIQYLHLPDTDNKTGLDDWLVCHPVEELWSLVEPTPPRLLRADKPRDTDRQPAAPKPAPARPVTLTRAHEVFHRWLGKSFDTDALDIMLSTAAMADDEGDPVWVIFISGSGNAKTEMVQALKGMGAEVTSAISSAGALLSATSNKEKSADATGGLLPKLQKDGTKVLVIKDFTTILSMDRNVRAEVMGALREVYDGRYQRNVGTDGGKTLTWEGRLVVIGACTTAWDRAHGVISVMGNRFVLVRVDSEDDASREEFGFQSIDNLGSETAMREQLTAAVGGVLAGRTQPPKITRPESLVLVRAANLATKARTAVDVDYQGNVDDAHASEAPTRLAKQLAQVVRGAVSLGIDRQRALQLAIRCAADSVPPMRLAILRDLDGVCQPSIASDVSKRIDKPRRSIDRQLQALHALGLATVKPGSSPWDYQMKAGVNPKVLDPNSCAEMLVDAHRHIEEMDRDSEDSDAGRASPPTHISATAGDPAELTPSCISGNGAAAPDRADPSTNGQAPPPGSGATRKPFCPGCGTFYANAGYHRGDCTSKQTAPEQASEEEGAR